MKDFNPLNVKTAEELDRLVADHQNLLSGGKMVEVISNLPVIFDNTPQRRFLEAVLYYHQLERSQDWYQAYAQFSFVISYVDSYPFDDAFWLVAFYLHNYAFLCARKVDADISVLNYHFAKAESNLLRIEDPLMFQLSGFLKCNYARFRLEQGDQAVGLAFYKEAALARVAYYNAKKVASTPSHELKFAAAPVCKIRRDWPHFFPDISIDECPVSEELFQEVAKLADSNFSATKKD